MAVFVGLILLLGSQLQQSTPAHAAKLSTMDQLPPNQPMGVGKGVFPGRVVWEYNPNSTNENCTNTQGDYWYLDKNTNQDTVSFMLSDGIQKMTGTSTNSAAWDSIFHYYNRTHGRGDVGYTAGEKIVIKINLNGFNNSNPDRNINTSPQICYAVLNQLVNVVGVAQANISIGDPNTNPRTFLNKCKTAFPNVIIWPGSGLPGSKNAVFVSSNGGWITPIPADAWKSQLPRPTWTPRT